MFDVAAVEIVTAACAAGAMQSTTAMLTALAWRAVTVCCFMTRSLYCGGLLIR
jgi:hypothetical protein